MLGGFGVFATNDTIASMGSEFFQNRRTSATSLVVLKDLHRPVVRAASSEARIMFAVGELYGQYLTLHDIEIPQQLFAESWQGWLGKCDQPILSLGEGTVGAWALDVVTTSIRKEASQVPRWNARNVPAQDILRLASEVFADSQPSTLQERLAFKKAVNRFLASRR